MGMYTELFMTAELRQDASQIVKDVVLFLFGDTATAVMPKELPDHAFFACHRWDCIGSMGSYYFTPFALSKAIDDGIGNAVYFTTRSDLKNYDDEIGLFIDFIKPYLATQGFIGYYRYEENEHPTLIYNVEPTA
jgi:hypothetical protein